MLTVVPSDVVDGDSGQQVCFDALRSGQARLCNLTQEQRTVSCCQLALCFDDQAWEAIPPAFKQLETLAEWVAHGLYKQKIFEGIPQVWRNMDFFRALLAFNSTLANFENQIFIQGIEHLGDEFIELVLSHEPRFLKHIPECDRTYERCIRAISARGELLQCVPDSLVDEALCIKALGQSPCLQYVPPALMNEKMVSLALNHIENDDDTINYGMEEEDIICIPSHLFTESICRRLLLGNIHCIAVLPSKLLTKQMCIDALKGKELMGFMLNEIFSYIPEDFREEVQQNAKFYHHIQPGEFDG